jgi:hypothetical protein
LDEGLTHRSRPARKDTRRRLKWRAVIQRFQKLRYFKEGAPLRQVCRRQLTPAQFLCAVATRRMLARHGLDRLVRGPTSASQSARATRRPTGPTISGPRAAILLPRRSTEIVRICEIFTHEGFGIMAAGSAIVNGNPALCAWLVIAIAITVFGFPVEQVVAENKDRPQSGLLAASDRVQVCPVHFASQYSGQAWSPRPCSANNISSFGSILASSRASRVRFSRSLSKFTAD